MAYEIVTLATAVLDYYGLLFFVFQVHCKHGQQFTIHHPRTTHLVKSCVILGYPGPRPARNRSLSRVSISPNLSAGRGWHHSWNTQPEINMVVSHGFPKHSPFDPFGSIWCLLNLLLSGDCSLRQTTMQFVVWASK